MSETRKFVTYVLSLPPEVNPYWEVANTLLADLKVRCLIFAPVNARRPL